MKIAGNMPELYVFTDDEEYHIIGYDVEDVWKIWEESSREKREDYEIEWRQLLDDKKLKIDLDGNYDNWTEKTCGEWILQEGRGYLCCSDY